MHHAFVIDPKVRNFADAGRAIAAVEKALKPYETGGPNGTRLCNVMVVYNANGRAVPLLINVSKDFMPIAMHLGFMMVT